MRKQDAFFSFFTFIEPDKMNDAKSADDDTSMTHNEIHNSATLNYEHLDANEKDPLGEEIVNSTFSRVCDA